MESIKLKCAKLRVACEKSSMDIELTAETLKEQRAQETAKWIRQQKMAYRFGLGCDYPERPGDWDSHTRPEEEEKKSDSDVLRQDGAYTFTKKDQIEKHIAKMRADAKNK